MLATMQAPAPYTEQNEFAEEYLLQDQLPEAAALLVEIVDNDPTNSRAFNNLGVIAWKQQNWYDSFGLFKHALELDTTNLDAAANLFDMALKTRRIDETRLLILRAAQTYPENDEFKDIALGLIEDGDEIYYCGRSLQQGYYHPELAKADYLVQ